MAKDRVVVASHSTTKLVGATPDQQLPPVAKGKPQYLGKSAAGSPDIGLRSYPSISSFEYDARLGGLQITPSISCASHYLSFVPLPRVATNSSRANLFISFVLLSSIFKMGMSASEVITPFLGALQASISVLLTIYVGVLVAQFQLLDSDAAKKVSRTSVRVFLPFLLITKVGNQLELETGTRYVPIISTQ